MATSRFQGAWLPKKGASGPPNRSATAALAAIPAIQASCQTMPLK